VSLDLVFDIVDLAEILAGGINFKHKKKKIDGAPDA